MKQVYAMLKWLLIGFIGVFIGSSLYQYYDYRKFEDLYLAQSAPWYTSIIVRGGFTLVIVMVIGIAMWILKKKMK